MMEEIAIIGGGVVGKATALILQYPNVVYDITEVEIPTFLERTKIVKEFPIAQHYFICVPTPLGEDDKLDVSAVIKVLDQIDKLEIENPRVFVRSTVSVPTMSMLASKYPKQELIYFPEFIREEHWINDARNPARTVITTNDIPQWLIGACGDEVICTYEEAAIIKLASNAFLAAKVAFFSDIYNLCGEMSNVNYNVVCYGITQDPRIGSSHTNLPLTIGGKCLPKDTKDLSNYMDGLVLLATTLYNNPKDSK